MYVVHRSRDFSQIEEDEKKRIMKERFTTVEDVKAKIDERAEVCTKRVSEAS